MATAALRGRKTTSRTSGVETDGDPGSIEVRFLEELWCFWNAGIEWDWLNKKTTAAAPFGSRTFQQHAFFFGVPRNPHIWKLPLLRLHQLREAKKDENRGRSDPPDTQSLVGYESSLPGRTAQP